MDIHRDVLIQFYYGLGILALKHGVIISLRHLHRLLKSMYLGRRRYSYVAEVLEFIQKELQSSGQLHGYRWMYQKCMNYKSERRTSE
jgi:hypothetical protein